MHVESTSNLLCDQPPKPFPVLIVVHQLAYLVDNLTFLPHNATFLGFVLLYNTNFVWIYKLFTLKRDKLLEPVIRWFSGF